MNLPPTGVPTGAHLWRIRRPQDLRRDARTTLATAQGDGLLGLPIGPDARPAESGTYLSEDRSLPPFDRAVLSWTCLCPRGAGIDTGLDLRVDGQWSEEESPSMGEVLETGERRSEEVPPRGAFALDVDTLRVLGGKCADGARIAVSLSTESGRSPVLYGLTLCTWVAGTRRPFAACRSSAWGRVLAVPERSQCLEDPALAGSICSPTSLAMVLEFWGVKLATAEVARGVYDAQARIYGNWPFNTAFAFEASAARLRESYVVRFAGLEDLEEEIGAGRPVVISHRWKKGELTGAPVETSDGHLVVVVGFDPRGDVVVNDPAADPRRGEQVRRTYARRELYHTWLENADGVAYRIGP